MAGLIKALSSTALNLFLLPSRIGGVTSVYASSSTFTVDSATAFNIGDRFKATGGADRYGTVSDISGLTIIAVDIHDSDGATQNLHASMSKVYPGYNSAIVTPINSPQVINSKATAKKLKVRSGRMLLLRGSDGGEFYGVTGAAPGTYSDNGGSYCGTQFIPTGGDGSSVWLRRNFDAYSRNEVNSVWFGVEGSGVETAKIQAAIDALNSGGVLNVSGIDITLANVTCNKSITIRGNATFDRDSGEHLTYRGGTRLKITGAVDGFTFTVGSVNKATYVNLENLFIDGQRTDEAKIVGSCITINGGDAATQYIVARLTNVAIWDAAEHGISLAGWIWHPRFENVHIDQCGKNSLRALNSGTTYADIHEGLFLGCAFFGGGQQYAAGSTNSNAANIYWNTPGGGNAWHRISCSNAQGRGALFARGRHVGSSWTLESNLADYPLYLGDAGTVLDEFSITGMQIAYAGAVSNVAGIYALTAQSRNITITGLFINPSASEQPTSGYDVVIGANCPRVAILNYHPASDGVTDVHGTPKISDASGVALITSGNKVVSSGAVALRIETTSSAGARSATIETYIPNSGGDDPAGSHDYLAKDSAGNETVYARSEARISDSTNASEDGYYQIAVVKGGTLTTVARVDATVTAGDTSLIVFDVDNNALERVSVGVADSGGAGFKVLRIPN